MGRSIWYISKYVSPPSETSAGGRGYILMRELAKLGHHCIIITSDSNHLANVPTLGAVHNLQEIDGLSLCWIRTLKYTSAKSLRRILSWLHFEWRLFRLPKKNIVPPDAVIVSSLSLLTILNGFLLRKRYGCRLIFEIRDIWPLTITEEGGFSRWNPLVLGLAFVEWLGYKYADEIIGTMPNLQEHVRNVLGYERKVWCIPMGVDLTASVDRLAVPQNYKDLYFKKGKFIIAHVGSIGISNALDVFMKCAESLIDNENIHFLLVGDGDLKAVYQQQYGHLPNLTFAPKIPKLMVQSLLNKCDLLYFSVHPSEVWLYGQSLNKVIDYMLSGRPIVASYDGFPSMINEADCGAYVAAGDPIALKKKIVDYSQTRAEVLAEMGARGRSWVLEHRKYEDLAEKYFEILFR
ncbi:glycosyltransferase family 4 protein [Alcaligenaceae bacterium CGII-47]|nr:glycosyltransferase family 4 protein [Alcaligenaceae bacterium CGII-47]